MNLTSPILEKVMKKLLTTHGTLRPFFLVPLASAKNLIVVIFKRLQRIGAGGSVLDGSGVYAPFQHSVFVVILISSGSAARCNDNYNLS